MIYLKLLKVMELFEKLDFMITCGESLNKNILTSTGISEYAVCIHGNLDILYLQKVI